MALIIQPGRSRRLTFGNMTPTSSKRPSGRSAPQPHLRTYGWPGQTPSGFSHLLWPLEGELHHLSARSCGPSWPPPVAHPCWAVMSGPGGVSPAGVSCFLAPKGWSEAVAAPSPPVPGTLGKTKLRSVTDTSASACGSSPVPLIWR